MVSDDTATPPAAAAADDNSVALWAACAHSVWYPVFEKITARSIIVDLPDEVRAYVLADPFVLPAECSPYLAEVTSSMPTIKITPNSPDGDQPNGADPFADDDSAESPPPNFSEFSNQLVAAIATLGGRAFMKTDWKAPVDAFWINAGQTMRTQDIVDVYQLLKASSFTRYDLLRGVDTGAQLHIVLREWLDVHPGTEFRCYVRGKALIAISPRDWPQYHGHIPGQKREIISDIRSLFLEHIKHRFPLDDYTFDVIRERKDCVSLVDFGPYGRKYSQSLAFDWDELEQLDMVITDDDPEFRYLSTDTGIQPSNKRNNYGIPRDIIEVYQAGTTDPPGDQHSDDDDDDDDDDADGGGGRGARRPGGRQTLEELFDRLLAVTENEYQMAEPE